MTIRVWWVTEEIRSCFGGAEKAASRHRKRNSTSELVAFCTGPRKNFRSYGNPYVATCVSLRHGDPPAGIQ
eukprot:scaffold40475_cov47-Attheya_sp.AAC.2